jgi:hypothetical protein
MAAEKPQGTLPLFLNLDVAFEKMSPYESPFIKGTEAGIDRNPLTSASNPTGEGQNALDLNPGSSNQPIPSAIAPKGFNKCVGTFWSDETNETYYANFNSLNNHGIYSISGDTMVWTTVIIDPNLPFTENQQDYLADHRWKIRVIRDSSGNIIEKFLTYQNSAGWQGFISVMAAIATQGFNASLYPYYQLKQPFFDRRELIELAMRPIMVNPIVAPIANTSADAGTVNRLIDRAFQFAAVVNYTDGRQGTYSPYSQPLIIKSEDYLNNPDLLPKKALITLYAGSCMVESIDIMVRFTATKQQGIPSEVTWGLWYKYTRLYKYTGSTTSPSDVLKTQYWLRTNPWASYSYDPINNTIQYVFDNSILPELTSQDNAKRIQNEIPIKSIASSDVNDAVALWDNLRGYPNFPSALTQNLSVNVLEKQSATCTLPIREVQLYAVAARPGPNLTWESQVAFYDGQDTQVRWGALQVGTSGNGLAAFSISQSKQFGLDFADHSGFVCYAKGTPYYTVGQWYLVDSANNLTALPALLDFSNNDVLAGVNQALLSQKYYICVFTFYLPAGRYNFCIGRHNVALNQDFKNTSTYVYGIANSRLRFPYYNGAASFLNNQSLIPGTVKEMEIDCTNGNVDVWGNGKDVFLIYCPSPPSSTGPWRFIEGYLKESASNQIGVEQFPYYLNIVADDWGKVTDKNGFYWAYTKKQSSSTANIEILCKLNCTYPYQFEIPSGVSGAVLGPINNNYAYLTDHNGGVVGACNQVLIQGVITDLTGTIPYSNISVSIANGGTVTTASDGTFTLIVHNGQPTLRTDNIYISAAGNFLVTLAGCIPMPLTIYNEALVPCIKCTTRTFPQAISFNVLIQGGTQQSVKQSGSYQVSIHGGDLAGRVTFENVFAYPTVPSFLQRNDTLATYFQAMVNGALNIPAGISWVAFSVSNQVNVKRYFQWVGDSIQYIDNQGNVVTDPSTAVFISIAINSFYNYAVSKNFDILATYQFSPDDRIVFIDDGNGNLLNAPPFKTGIDLPILGTNYNQAVQTAGIVPNTNTIPIVNVANNTNVSNTVNTSGGSPTTTTTIATSQNNTSITLYVKFDNRLAQLKNDTGFWIEIYTPAQQPKEIPYNELQWYPVINGAIAQFSGIVNSTPTFTYPTQFTLPFWDTYLFYRNITIPNVGNKFLNHPFESPNISDSFGANVNSGGRQLTKNDNATQQWYPAEVSKSDPFVGNGIINGIGTFRSENRKDFSQYPYGPVIAAHTERSIIFVLCENDWFTVSFDFHFTYPNAQGVMVVNLDNNISTPNQKVGSNFGICAEDTGSLIFNDKTISWLDANNQAFVLCDYRDAKDISDIRDENGRQLGVKSYFIKKIQWMKQWNSTADITNLMDVVSGVDLVKKNIYLTFRKRRGNSNDARSYVNRRRNIDVTQSETIVFGWGYSRWLRFHGATPEAYCTIKGNKSGLRLLVFAAGIPYMGGSPASQPQFLNYFGVQTEAVFMTNFNTPADVAKVFQSLSYDSEGGFFCDDVFTGQPLFFSYIPVNFFQIKEGIYYSQFMRDMYSYPKPGNSNLFRGMLWDGGRVVDVYCIVRFVTDPNTPGSYFQLNNIFASHTTNYPDKK